MHAYRARLIEALERDFPGLRALSGADAFAELCGAYIEATPSKHFNVRWYGQNLPTFLQSTRPWSDARYFSEMAELEWKIGLSFDAADTASVHANHIERLSKDGWADLRLSLQPAVQRIALYWNVAEIRQAHLNEEPWTLRHCGDRQFWIISRQDYLVRFRQLDEDEAAALDSVAHGATLAELCELLCLWHEHHEVAARVAMLLKAWISNQWIERIE